MTESTYMPWFEKWDQRYVDLAYKISTWSKDPSTQVGCVIVRPDRTVASIGYNGFPREVHDTHDRLHHRPTKYAFMVHSEINAITAAREVLHGCTAYTVPFPPCSTCAGALIQAGITRIVAPDATDEQKERWGDSFTFANQMYEEAGVELVLV